MMAGFKRILLPVENRMHYKCQI